MNIKDLKIPKGFRDFLPSEAKKRQYVLEIIKNTFELYGFEPLETPALEYSEILLGKYGEEGDKLVYTFEDKGGRNVALRYDQTVPTARVLAVNQQNLPIPFRRYQIQNVWRADKPQSGRYREFLQCDADIYGSFSYLADAEVIALSNDVFKNLGFKNFNIYINDRKILFDLMNWASIPENLQLPVIAAIDKLDRKSKEDIKQDLINLGISEQSINHLYNHLESTKVTRNIEKIIDGSISLGVNKEKLLFHARLARGLDYYTSTIFEVKTNEYKSGSLAGGGRYDKLIEDLSGISIPAVGIAFGFDRIMEAMEQNKLLPKEVRSDVLVTIFSPEYVENSALITETIRKNNIAAELFPNESIDLKKQLKYADKKGIKWLIVIGPDEIKNNKVILKNLETGFQEEIKIKDLIEEINKRNK